MKNRKNEAVFRCTVAAPSMIGFALLLCCICLVIIFAVLSMDAPRVAKYFVLSPVIVYFTFLVANLIIETASVLTIGSEGICLTRFGVVVTRFRPEEVTSAGFFTKHGGRGQYLYISAYVCDNTAEKTSNILYYQIKKTANKKNSRFICIEKTDSRIHAMKAMLPAFCSLNNIKFENS